MFEMTKNVLKNLMGKTSTRLYPFTTREPFERSRGSLDIDPDECIYCGTCAKKCPSQCIEVDVKGRTWSCDTFSCVYCSVCVEACPVQCMTMSTTTKPPVGDRSDVTIFYKGKSKAPKEHKVFVEPAASAAPAKAAAPAKPVASMEKKVKAAKPAKAAK